MEMDQSIKRYTKQYPIGPALNIDVKMENGTVGFKWTDPKNPILDKIYFSKWEKTIIIKTEDTPPASKYEGEVILSTNVYNEYQDTWFIDDDIEYGHIYYYAIIPCSDLGKYTYNTDKAIKIIPREYDTTLENNTWVTIHDMIESRVADKIWKIGDSKLITIGESNINLTIEDFIIKDNQVQEVRFGTDVLFDNALPLTDLLPEAIMTYNPTISIVDYRNRIYTSNPSRIKKYNGVATPYVIGNRLFIDETGKILEGEYNGESTSLQITL